MTSARPETARSERIRVSSEVLDNAMTPAQWVEELATRGILTTERTLRAYANRLGARLKLGNAMIITSSQMDTILTEGTECLSNRASAKTANTSTRRVESNTTEGQSPAHTTKALAHLRKLAHGTG